MGRGWVAGVATRPLLDVLSGLQALVDALDPGQGIGVGEGVTLLETAIGVAAAPAVAEALAGGVVSPRQARAAARAEAARPGEGARLVEKAGSVSVTELETDANRVVAAASSESETERAARLRKKRSLRTGTDADGGDHEWFSAGECSIDGCTSPARIEIDHVADWAHTHVTTLPDLASPCGHHHDLTTHHGHTFGPRLPNGKRRLIPPGGTDPPGHGPAGPADDAEQTDVDQPALFDTS